MTLATAKLPKDFDSLKAMYLEETRLLKHELANKAAEIQYLEELLKLSKHKRFGQSSEKFAGMKNLFNEAEDELVDGESSEEEQQQDEKSKKKKNNRGKPKRAPLPDHLPRKDVVIDLPELERLGCDGKPLKEIGEEVSEHVEIEPAKITVIRTIRKKYGGCSCESCLKTSPVPVRPIPKSIAGAGLLAFIIVSKYCDGLPLNRLAGVLKRSGIDITRGLMAGWMIRVASLLTPLYNLLEDELLASSYINCDETRVQVLKEDGKSATSQSYMWVRCRAGPAENPIILYEYDPTRSGSVPVRLLEGFKGYLQVDAYSGYDRVCADSGIIRVGCWAHGRRKFEEAIKGHKNPKKARVAKKALKYIGLLSKVEKECEGKSLEETVKIRQEKSQPILDEMHAWLTEAKDQVPPKTLTGKALYYVDAQWDTLTVYVDDGRLKMTNNVAENVIRPFVIGRKAWLFSSTPNGARASAILYSLIITARANGLDAYKYMRHVLNEIPKAQTAEDYEALLPHRVDMADAVQ